ncbi:MAG: transposase [Kordia sp.]|nr:transposase [Kordia sp.]MCH2196678.1 transposase [Kordia sp.]
MNYTEPREPTQNEYVERFNKTFREDVLDAYIFSNIEEASDIAEDFRKDYNEYHPHKSLGRKSLNEVLREFTKGLAPL